MIRLHLVGFTTDLKSLIFSRTRGAKSGNFIVGIDPRLRTTLEEVSRLEEEKKKAEAAKSARDGKTSAPVPASKLTPKEIQSLLRKGKSIQEVARAAETHTSWIERFANPVLAERAGVVQAVRSGTISKARLGPSSAPVGEAIASNLREKKINIPPELLDESWSARLRDRHWEVTFRYLSRGRRREATFSYDAAARMVNPLNSVARDLAWRPAGARSARAGKPRGGRRGGRAKP